MPENNQNCNSRIGPDGRFDCFGSDPCAYHKCSKAVCQCQDGDMPPSVNHPDHYNWHPAGIECIDVIEAFDYNPGCVIKYVWRAGRKTDDALEDLRKARWYIDREIERLSE